MINATPPGNALRQVPIQIPVTFDSANRKRDKSVSLRFTTNLEISNSDFAKMDLLVGHSGWLVYADNEIQPNEIPNVPADEALGGMTPSQEQRWLIKRIYDSKERDIEWPDFYKNQVGMINKQLRDKLEG